MAEAQHKLTDTVLMQVPPFAPTPHPPSPLLPGGEGARFSISDGGIDAVDETAADWTHSYFATGRCGGYQSMMVLQLPMTQ